MASNKTYAEKLKSPKWQKKRLEIMERDGFQCQICFDREETLTVHHKYYLSGKDPWDYNNECYITLCEDCHESVHLWEDNHKKHPEQYMILPVFNNITELRILIERMRMITEREGSNGINSITHLLTAYVIDIKDI